MSTEQNKELVRRFYDEWSKGSVEGVGDLYADDAIDHNSQPGQASGKAGIKQTVELIISAFSDSQLSLDRVIADGDKVVDQGTFSGTHTGPLFGIPPTGKRITITLTDIHRVENGKFVEVWHIEDILGMMQQVGAIPSRA